MTILILNWRDPKNPKAGGAEIVTLEHAKAWVKKGYKVIWFSPQFPGSKKNESFDGIRIIRAGNFLLNYLYAPFFYYFSGHKFDVVIDQIHGIPFFTPLYVKKRKIAFIHEVAGEIWNYMYPFPINKIGQLLEKYYFYFYRNITFWVVSKSTVNELEKYGIKKSYCVVIPNGIQNKPLFTLPKKEKKFTLLFVGRIVKMKGIENVIAAFHQIQLNDKNSQLWIVGTGEKIYLEKIKKIIKNYNLEKNVTFFGSVSEEKKFELMRRTHLLLHASVKEGWGLVVIEAASQATPSVVYRVNGLIDAVKHNKTGIIVSNNTPENLARAAIQLIKDEKKYQFFQKNCLAWARSLSWNRITPLSLQLLNNG